MKKSVADLTPEEQEAQREKWRVEKRQERAAEKASQKIAETPSADEWVWNFADNFPGQDKDLDGYAKQIEEKVAEEIGRSLVSNGETYTLDRVARTLFSLKKNTNPWVREVHSPNGVIAGGLYFPEAFGSDLISSVNKFGLKKSPTFTALYQELLRILDKKFGVRPGDGAFERRCAADIKAELERAA